MARKAKPVEIDADSLNTTHPAIIDAHEQSAQLVTIQREDAARVRAVALQLGYQLPADCTDPDLIQRDIAANMRRSVEACLEVGRGLRVLKEACEHGQFHARLEVLGLDIHVASRFMQSATKFSKLPTSATLTRAIGNQSKLFEMLVLDDEELEELELTGQTGELKLDDVATMSVKELRNAIRVSREVMAQKTKRIEQMAAENEALVEKYARVKKAKPDEVLKDLKQTLTSFTLDLEFGIANNVAAAVKALAEHNEKHGDADQDSLGVAALIATELGRLETTLRDLRQQYAGVSDEDVAAWAK